MAKKDQEPNVSASPETGTETNPDVPVPKKVGRPRKTDKDKPESKDKTIVARKTRAKKDDLKDSEPAPDKEKNPPATNREAIILAEIKTNDPDKVDEDLKNTLDPYVPIEIENMPDEEKEMVVNAADYPLNKIKRHEELLGHAHKIVEGKHGDYPMGKSIYYSEDKKREVIKAIKEGKKPEEIPNIPEPPETDEAKAERADIAAKEKAISDTVFIERAKKFWDQFAVHGGKVKKNAEGKVEIDAEGNSIVECRSDLDGESCLEMLRLAGLDMTKIKARLRYVEQGKYVEKYFTMDSGGKHGIVSINRGETAIADHHGKESGKDTSGTKFMYKALVGMGFMKQEKYLDNYVNFVTDEDNKNYTDEQFRYLAKNLHRTIMGLHDKNKPDVLSVPEILDLFKRGFSRFHVWGDDFLKSHKFYNTFVRKNQTLLDESSRVKDRMESTRSQLEEMRNEGFIFDSGDEQKYGIMIIDTGIERPPNGNKTGSGEGYEQRKIDTKISITEVVRSEYPNKHTLIQWIPGTNTFRIFPSVPFKPDEIKLPEGLYARGFWTKPPSEEEISITLQELLEKHLLPGKKFSYTGKLKEYIDQENETVLVRRNLEARENMDFTEEEMANVMNWAQFARERLDNIEQEIRGYYKSKGSTEEEIKKRIDIAVEDFWEIKMEEKILEWIEKYGFVMREELIPKAIKKIKFESDMAKLSNAWNATIDEKIKE